MEGSSPVVYVGIIDHIIDYMLNLEVIARTHCHRMNSDYLMRLFWCWDSIKPEVEWYPWLKLPSGILWFYPMAMSCFFYTTNICFTDGPIELVSYHTVNDVFVV